MLAVVDADYKFTWLDIGANGACSDAQIYNQSEIKEGLENNYLGLPPDECLPGDNKPVPYSLIGDDAFALTKRMMKPFGHRALTKEERIFNYRLSRARRVVENAFGILVNRFRCMLTTMLQDPGTVAKIALTCCILHNICRICYPRLHVHLCDREDAQYNLIPGAWRNGVNLQDIGEILRGNTSNKEAKAQRLLLKHYYNSPVGSVSWQERMI